MFCSECGEKLAEDARFCHNCGVEVETPEAPETGVPEPPEPAPRVPEPAPPPVPQPAYQPALPAPTGAPPGAPAQPEAGGPATAMPPAGQAPSLEQPPVAYGAPESPAGPPAEPKQTGTSCWLIGCIVAAVLFLIVVIVGFFVLRYGWVRFQELLEEGGGSVSLDAAPGDSDTEAGGAAGPDTTGLEDLDSILGKNIAEAVREGRKAAQEAQTGMRSIKTMIGAIATAGRFLRAYQEQDLDAMNEFLSADLRKSMDPDVWRLGEYEHLSFDMVGQEEKSPAHYRFKVVEKGRSSDSGEEFRETFWLAVTWNGQVWEISALQVQAD